jgi:hypothetical protein
MAEGARRTDARGWERSRERGEEGRWWTGVL